MQITKIELSFVKILQLDQIFVGSLFKQLPEEIDVGLF